jgi:hypothetical protein
MRFGPPRLTNRTRPPRRTNVESQGTLDGKKSKQGAAEADSHVCLSRHLGGANLHRVMPLRQSCSGAEPDTLGSRFPGGGAKTGSLTTNSPRSSGGLNRCPGGQAQGPGRSDRAMLPLSSCMRRCGQSPIGTSAVCGLRFRFDWVRHVVSTLNWRDRAGLIRQQTRISRRA